MIDFFVSAISIVSALTAIVVSLVEALKLWPKSADKAMADKLFVITARAEEFASAAQAAGQGEAEKQELRRLILGEVWEQHKANIRSNAYLEEYLSPALYEMLVQLLWSRKIEKWEKCKKSLHDIFARSTVYMTFEKVQRDKAYDRVYSHLTEKAWKKREPYTFTFKNMAAYQHIISYKMLGLAKEPGISGFKVKDHPCEWYRRTVASSAFDSPRVVLIHFLPDREKAAEPEYYLKITEKEFADLAEDRASTLCLPPARDYSQSD